MNNQTITIDENAEKAACNCICPYDLSFKIGPLDRGTYTFILNKDNAEYYIFTLDFNTTVDTTVYINKTK